MYALNPDNHDAIAVAIAEDAKQYILLQGGSVSVELRTSFG